MKKSFIVFIGLFFLPVLVWSATTSVSTYPNDKITVNWDDKASMQRGARVFVNYCMGCHAAAYSRYNRVGSDLGISDEQMRNNLIFTVDQWGEKTKVGELMKINMQSEYAEAAFGTAPPDLSLIARSRGINWLYNYLRGFYVDEGRPFGINNSIFDNVGMPHTLIELQGLQKAVKAIRPDGQGGKHEVIVGFELLEPGTLSKSEYDQTIYDLVAFLDYISEPYRQTRHHVGIGVIIYLFIFLILAYFLKREFWKDIY